MIERISHVAAPALAEDDGNSERLRTLELLRARLSRTVSEGLEQGAGASQRGEIDSAEIAAFLDGSLSGPEWDAVAARLVNDPATRAELAAAAAMVDEIQAQPVTIPAGVMARAAGVLACTEQGRPRVPAVTVTPVVGYRRSMAWSGVALAVLAVVAVPAVLKMTGEGTTAGKHGGTGDTFSRGIVATPSSPAKKKDAQSCIDANGQAGKPTPDSTGRTARPDEGSTESNDPCKPKPPEAGMQERPAPARSN
jgi:hypothetical protein